MVSASACALSMGQPSLTTRLISQSAPTRLADPQWMNGGIELKETLLL
jgi:hypothetical protein